MNCAIYGRVSTTRQENANQLIQLREFARTQGWTITAEYCDEMTGSTADRPAFKRMFEAASRRKFDVLLFWALDRLTREGVLETLQYLERLTSYGIKWRSLSEQYIDSCGIFADAVIGIMATIAKQERIRRSERTKAGLARTRAEGTRLGRPKVDVDADRVRQLRSEGRSWPQIANELGLSRSVVQRSLA
jgi:DNA invertase Pin-like site-specific DNA recombinase